MRRQQGKGIGKFLKGAVRVTKRALASDVGKAVVRIAKPLVQAAVQRKLAQRGINIGGGLRLAGTGKRRKAPRRRAAAPRLRKQLVYL